MARRKKISVTSGMLKDELIKTIKKDLRKIEAKKKSKTTAIKTKSTVRKKSPVKENAKKVPAKKSTTRKPKTVRSPKTVKSQTRSTPIEADLPEYYGDHRLVMLARDPNWAYAYWDLNPTLVRDLLKSASQTADKARWILRVYSSSLHPVKDRGLFFDIDIDAKTDNYYLDLSRPGARFIVEIGVIDASGIFQATAQSNPIILPMNHPSETIAPERTAPSEAPVSTDGSDFTKSSASRY